MRLGTITPSAGEFLRLAVQGRLNIVVAGGTASGKSNFVNAVANAVWLLSHDGATGSLLLNRGGLAAKLALPQAPLADLPDVGRSRPLGRSWGST